MKTNNYIYKYVNKEDGMRILFDNTLKFSSPNDFNDPFDCSEELLRYDITREFIEEQTEIGILKFENNEDKLPLYVQKRLLAPLYNSDNKTIRGSLEFLRNDLKISCFSELYNQILMWSHYTDKHNGFCIGFDLDLLSDSIEFILSKVNYSHDFEKINYCLSPSNALEYMISNKSIHWEYEKEIRLRTNIRKTKFKDPENGIVEINKDCIKEIYVGNKTRLNEEEAYLLETKYSNFNVIIKKMELDKNSFKLNDVNWINN
jgi:hypothetical protein